MSAPFSTNLTRVIELLAELSTSPLAPDQQQELDRLTAALSPDERAIAASERLRLHDAAAQALALMVQRDRATPLPAGLRDKLLAAGMAELGTSSNPRSANADPADAPAQRPGPSRFAIYTGWIVAAASIALAATVYFNRPAPPAITPFEPPSVFALRDQLKGYSDTVTVPWTATQDPGAAGAGGEVLWNQRLQRGFLRLKGLAENDPQKFQYQLWIFDKGRIEPDHNNDLLKQFPIDGGVFDVGIAHRDPATGDYIIPIDPRIPVLDAGAFAITSEPPGGVVVTKREHLLLLAPVKS